MKKHQKSTLVLALITAFVAAGLFLPGPARAGELEPTGPPGPTMKTLQDIYDKLDAIARDVFEIKTGCPPHWRFCDMGDGTILDIETGLIWLKDANTRCSTWEQARQYADDLIFAGFDDWRLPTIQEWRAFVDTTYTNPALCNAAGDGQWSYGDAFIDVETARAYWSGEEWSGNASMAWVVALINGFTYPMTKTYDYYAWPVRDN